MKQYIQDLFQGSERWRVELFIDKMNSLKKEATINEVGQFAIEAQREAQLLLKSMP